ncbi:Metallo-dependent phosphatase-like protein [Podospora australis]|uniref:Metallo-dependent phosphatase-like protein n=1 Tax=Podospora australis TaxID=1536484 RepID=A0AAN7AKW6_9PEZI|nr:Metallo-dependent phosphatase-like protein [Podospora australis]
MPDIKTRILILSDTHNQPGITLPNLPVDVAIHCGDLTSRSQIHEFHSAISLLKKINARLKLVIAGNHDYTLDAPFFWNQLAPSLAEKAAPELIVEKYGNPGEARQLFNSYSPEIVFLDEGIHRFSLSNGADLKVYASPFTPSRGPHWTLGFQYLPDQYHGFAITKGAVDIVITHGPPLGVLDEIIPSARKYPPHVGCKHLLKAIAQARPRLHCFGHIHEGWGAKLVTWRRDNIASGNDGGPDYEGAIDQDATITTETLDTLLPSQQDSPEVASERQRRLMAFWTDGYRYASHCANDPHPLTPGRNTLFANAAIQPSHKDTRNGGLQLPWIVDIELPATSTTP